MKIVVRYLTAYNTSIEKFKGKYDVCGVEKDTLLTDIRMKTYLFAFLNTTRAFSLLIKIYLRGRIRFDGTRKL
jgi:hypothetical protein